MAESAKIEKVSGRCVPVRGNDIDTDRIIPARFMKVVTFEGLGEFAFNDERYTEEGRLKDHPFNSEAYKDASILLVNKNFGCGSSREHAPQALMRWGINAIVGESFSEIFAGNCNSMGIPAVTVSSAAMEQLMSAVESDPKLEIILNISKGALRYGSVVIPVHIDPSAGKALLSGNWDSTSGLLASMDDIKKKERELQYYK